MKQIMKKTMSLALAMIMLFSCATTALALETEQMDEESAGDVTLSATSVTLSQSEDEQTVNISLLVNKNICVAGLSVNYAVSDSDGQVTLGTGVAGNSLSGSISAQGMNVSNGNGAYMTCDSTNQAYTLCTVPVTIAANVTGTYMVTFSNVEISDANNGDGYSLNSKSVAATITVNSTTPEVTDAYTAALSSTTTTVDNDGTSTVSVDVVVGGTTGSFASTEIKLAYDPTYLTFNANGSSCKLSAAVSEGQTDQAVSISAEDGVITIRDYGGTMTVDTNGTTAYTVVFNTVEGGNTDVSLTSAGFSTQDNAASENLTYVTDTNSEVSVTIKHKVTISEKDSTGTPTVEYVAPDGDYTFTIPGYDAGYTYTVSATIDGKSDSEEDIVDNGNGSYTVKNVTGALAITFEKTAISYTVTFDDKTGETTTVVSNVTGAALANSVYTVPYNTAVGFAVAAGLAPNGTANGYYYSVRAYLTDNTNTAVTVSSTETDNYAAKTYTIAAGAITDDITIEVTKVEVSASQTTIEINGPYTEVLIDGTALTSQTITVEKNKDIIFTLNKEDGYIYTVKTKIGDAEATVVEPDANGSYTINAGDSGLILQIFKALDTSSLSVSQYVQLDGTVMWLVKINYNNNTQIEGKTYTYDNNNMFWSSKYQTYCYLIVAESDPYNNADDQAKAAFVEKLRLTEGTATAINYNGNVNLTTNTEGAAIIDVNDAQLVWNMYSAVYSNTGTVSVQKFLEADMTGNGSLGTDDAAAVVSAIG